MTVVAKQVNTFPRRPGGVCHLKLKDVDTTGKRIAGYYTAFNNIDAHRDRGRKGMTLKSIAETGPASVHPRIKHFQNHRIDQPLTPLLEMGEDNIGAFYVGKIVEDNDQHDLVRNFLKMARAGLITEHSYALSPIRWQYDEKTDITDLLEVKVWEVSSLTFMGANEMTPFTEIGKGMTPEEQIQYWSEKQTAIDKFCRDTDATDDCIESLLFYCKELTQHIITLSTTTPATTVSAGGTAPDYSGLLSILNETKSLYTNI